MRSFVHNKASLFFPNQRLFYRARETKRIVFFPAVIYIRACVKECFATSRVFCVVSIASAHDFLVGVCRMSSALLARDISRRSVFHSRPQKQEKEPGKGTMQLNASKPATRGKKNQKRVLLFCQHHTANLHRCVPRQGVSIN